jgi:hypothetical protein
MGYGMRKSDSYSVLICSIIVSKQVMPKNIKLHDSDVISLTIPTPVLSGSGSKGSLRISAIKIVNNFQAPLGSVCILTIFV